MRFVRTAENLFGLPLGFTRLETIESTGTQYIDTGVDAKTGLTIEAKIKYVSHTGIFCGAITTSEGTGDRYYAINFSQQNKVAFTYLDTAFTGSTSLTAGNIYTIKTVLGLTRQEIFVDGVSKGYTTKTDNVDLHWTLGLFALHRGGSFTPEWFSESKAILYYCKIWDGDTLVRDFIPCIDPLGVPCMYDLVGKKPYYNQGTGTFNVGRQVIPVEYLESSGTQWLKTDYTLTANTKIDIAFSPNQQTTANLWVIGSYVASNKLTGVRITGETTMDCYINTVVSKKVSGSNIGNKYQAVLDGKWTVNGSEGTAVTVSAGLSPLILFGWNASQTANTYSISGLCSTKIYHCKIWDDDVLVRDYIPCKDENNVGFMFDKVSGTCYLNAGTGAFSVGEPVYTSKLRLIKDTDGKVRFIQDVLPREYRPLKYLESSGTQFILTGFTPTLNTDFEIELSSTDTLTRWVMGCPTWVGVHYKNGTEVGITNSSTSAFQKYTSYNHDNSKLTMKLVGSTVYANGVSLGTITRRAGTLDFALFGYRDANQGATLFFVGNIYKCIIWDNGVPVRDFYPALRKSDNKPGMYDRITKQFFVNQGTGEFSYE